MSSRVLSLVGLLALGARAHPETDKVGNPLDEFSDHPHDTDPIVVDFSVDCASMDKRECRRNVANCAYHAHLEICRNHDGCIDLVHRDDCLSQYHCFWTGQAKEFDDVAQKEFPCQVYEEHVSCDSLADRYGQSGSIAGQIHLCEKNPRCFWDDFWTTCRGSEESDMSGRLEADNVAGVGRYRGDPCEGKQKKVCQADADCEWRGDSKTKHEEDPDKLFAETTAAKKDGTWWNFKGGSTEYEEVSVYDEKGEVIGSEKVYQRQGSSPGDACRSASAAIRAENHGHTRPTDMACGDLFNMYDCQQHRSGCEWEQCTNRLQPERPTCRVKDCCGRTTPPQTYCNTPADDIDQN